MTAGDAPVTPAAVPRRARPRWYGPAMKITRRVHMYLGLILFPWVAFYGLTGMLFNHPDIGRGIERRAVDREELAAASAFRPWSPEDVARHVVAAIEAGTPGGYRLDGDAAFSGWPLLAAPARDGGRHALMIDLADGSAELARHPAPPPAERVPFAQDALDLPAYRMSAVEAQVAAALPKLGIDAAAPLKAHPKIAPELRFRMRDAQGTLWNVTYDVRTGAVSGRRTEDGGLPFVELLERLHTQHHYPVSADATWLWALFADITGITLVIWALTGLLMWWQMKPTRVLGALAITAAIVAAGALWARTADHVQFGAADKSGP